MDFIETSIYITAGKSKQTALTYGIEEKGDNHIGIGKEFKHHKKQKDKNKAAGKYLNLSPED